MKFSDLLHGVDVIGRAGEAEISSLAYDSRRVKPGDLFFAMHGETTDGNRYIESAIRAGAVAVVSDEPAGGAGKWPVAAWATVPHGRRALATMSANVFQHPENKLKISGVTGTNGKTTTSLVLENLLRAGGRRTSLIGTIEYRVAGEKLESPHTTPEPLDLYVIFDQSVQRRVAEVSMEVSSHGLEQGRVYGVPFDVAIFTNLTRDHLDYHRTMDRYFAAKLLLFNGGNGPPPRVAVVNLDDEYGRSLADVVARAGSKALTYGLHSGDFHASSVEQSREGTSFQLHTPEGAMAVCSPLIGEINLYNLLAASAAASARGLSLAQIGEGIRRIEAVPGRFERVASGQPFTVVVDYAHTDDGLRNLTRIGRRYVGADKRVITVFGCGGDRDRKKRPLMGKAAGEGSDFVVLTSDNPRSEDPMAIIREAQVGLEETKVKFAVEADREVAIRQALSAAGEGDIVLIAGKGHEKTQTAAGRTIPFDDVEVARRILESLGYSGAAKLVQV